MMQTRWRLGLEGAPLFHHIAQAATHPIQGAGPPPQTSEMELSTSGALSSLALWLCVPQNSAVLFQSPLRHMTEHHWIQTIWCQCVWSTQNMTSEPRHGYASLPPLNMLPNAKLRSKTKKLKRQRCGAVDVHDCLKRHSAQSETIICHRRSQRVPLQSGCTTGTMNNGHVRKVSTCFLGVRHAAKNTPQKASHAYANANL